MDATTIMRQADPRNGKVKMPDYIEVRSTTDSQEDADKICAAVVEARLAAFGPGFGPLRPPFFWAWQIARAAEEYLLTMKTTQDKFSALAQVIRQNHSYDVPDIVAVPVVEGTEDYLGWISAETQASGGSA